MLAAANASLATPEEYRALHEVIGRFPLPLHLVAGNHDNPEKLLAEFGNTRFLGGTTHYTADTLVVLDSAAGHLGAEQLAWLDRTLATTGPAFVCLHHPPIPVGIPFLDRQRLTDGEQLAAVVERHDVTAVPDYLPEPTSFLLHLDGTTHTVPVSHAAGTVACY